jgi:CheY-like chemotaxis protein
MNPNLQILVAEDNEDDVFILQRALRKAGVANPMHVCPDGQEVLNYLKGEGPYADRAKYPFPRLLLLDLKMPRLSGLDVLRWLHEHPECNVIPKVVLTSSREPRDVSEAYRFGANAYLCKPASFEDLQRQLAAMQMFWEFCELPEMPAKC